MIEIEGDGSLKYMSGGHRSTLGEVSVGTLRSLFDEYNVEPRGIIHVGAHVGEEVPLYRSLGFERIYLIEPGHEAFSRLYAKYGTRHNDADVSTYHFAIHNDDTRTVYMVSADHTLRTYIGPDRDGGNVTALRLSKLQEHMVWGPDVDDPSDTGTLRYPNVLVVDTQGSELDVIKSADLDHIEVIIAETRDPGSEAPAADFGEVVEYLKIEGCSPVERWRHGQHVYSDVVFVFNTNGRQE